MNTSALNLGRSFPRTPVALRDVLGRVATWIAVYRERTQLSDLDDHMLEDIGITREQALKETGRAFWDTAHR